MNTFITSQPILNSKKVVVGYEIVYSKEGNSLYNQNDDSSALSIVSFFNYMEDNEVLRGKEAYLTFTPNIIMRDIPLFFDSKKLVIQVDGNLLVNKYFVAYLNQYREQGFKFALLNFEFKKHFMNILHLFDIIKIDFSNKEQDIDDIVRMAKGMNLKVCAYNVNTEKDRDYANKLELDYYQGESVADMVRTNIKKMDHLKANFLRLVAAISKEEPEFDEIADIIRLDVTLTFSLLKIVNSAYFALPNRVKEVSQALAILGLTQLKQWIYLLSFSSDNGLQQELIKTSFTRASFCQDLAKSIPRLPITNEEAYLLGMFSTLDVLLEAPMGMVLKQLPINDLIKDALINDEGICATLIKIVVAYEKAHWGEVNTLAEELNINTKNFSTKYMTVLAEVNKIWGSLTTT